MSHQGLFHDEETGLIYVRNRYLLWHLGRMNTHDGAGYAFEPEKWISTYFKGDDSRTIKRIDSDSDNDIDANDDVRHFYYSAGWQAMEETLDTGSGEQTERQFVHGLRYVDDIVLRDRDLDGDGDTTDVSGGSERHYVLQDANFNAIALADDAGDVVERFRYTPYGERTVLDVDFTDDGDNVSDFDLNYGHQGLMLDAESGFYQNRNRYWLWHLGRFNITDQLGYPDGSNRYTGYHVVHGRTDPSGLKTLKNYLIEKRDELYSHHPNETGSQSGEEGEGLIKTDCITYVMRVLVYGYEQIGKPDVAKKIRQKSGKATELFKYLVSIGWEAYYWNPDFSNAAAEGEHSVTYQTAKIKMTYYGIKLTDRYINYKRIQPGSRLNNVEDGNWAKLKAIEFGVGTGGGGLHAWIFGNGNVYEVHWNEKKGSDNLYERSSLKDKSAKTKSWGSGVILTPPDIEEPEPETTQTGCYRTSDLYCYWGQQSSDIE